MYCFTKNIVGDLADVEMLVPEKGVDGYQPSNKDIRKLAGADVIIENGFSFEPWLDPLIPAVLKAGAVRIVASRGIPPLPGGGPAPADLPPPPNPCVWLDPLLAITELQNIRDGLMARDPVNAESFLLNENRYETVLRDLDDEVGQATVDLPRRRMLCLTDAFAYFLRRYELPPTAVLKLPAPHLGQRRTMPSPLIDGLLFPGGLKPMQAVLISTLDLPNVEGLSNESSLPAVIADPMESGPASTDYYEKVTRANVAAFRKALH